MFGSNLQTFERQKNVFVYPDTRRTIDACRNLHIGERAFIIANGPSLRVADLEQMKNEITFAANKVYLSYDQTNWRPTYWCCSDRLVAEQNKSTISRLPHIKFGAYVVEAELASIPSTYIIPMTRRVSGKQGALADIDLSKGVHPGVSVVLFMLKLAYWMGISTIYVIGLDFDFAVPTGSANGEKVAGNEVIVSAGEVNHFHPDYRKPGEKWTYPLLDEQRKEFALIKWRFEAEGRRILNASRRSKLNVFDRIELEKVLQFT